MGMKVELPLADLAVAHGLPRPVAEYRFAAPRRWRLDAAWVEHKVALECNGGLWVRGRHSRGRGQEADYEKHAAATLAGWRVFWASTGQVDSGEAFRWVRAALAAGVGRDGR